MDKKSTRPLGGPRYALVAQALLDDILAGRYPVGSKLPTEHELCKQFNISRHTTREAIRRLQMMGLVSRHAGIGTIVESDHVAQRYVQVGDTISDLEKYARDVALNLLEVTDIKADEETASLLGCEPGQGWLRLHALRLMPQETKPISLTDIYVAERYRGIFDGVETSTAPVYAQINERFGIVASEIKQSITATTLSESQAEKLLATPGEAALVVTRHFLSDTAKLFEVALNIYPAARFTYANTLRIEPNETP